MSINAPSGGLWSAEDTPSNARLNRKEFFIGTGQQIQALSQTWPGMPVICLLDGGGLQGGLSYIRSPDNTTWIPLGLRRHTHATDTDADGGKAVDILFNSLENIYWNNKNDFKSTMVLQNSSGGTLTDDPDTGSCILNSSAVAGNYAEFRDTGLQFDFGSKMKMMFKCYCDSNTFTTMKIGPGMESLEFSNNTNKKLGFEICDTLGTPRNWDVTSADGVQRTTTTSTAVAKSTVAQGFKLVFTPFQTLQFYVNGVLNTTKNINVPNSGGADPSNIMGAGIKTNNAIVKKFYLYGYSMLGSVGEGTTWS